MLPDELIGDSGLLQQMIGVCTDIGGSVVGVQQVARHLVSSYGVIDPSGPVDQHGVIRVRDLVEKPSVEDAPSDYTLIGRYVLTPDIFDTIGELTPGRGGELQLTDALRVQAQSSPFAAVVSHFERHDTGNPVGFLAAAIEFALQDPEMTDAVRAVLDRHCGG